MCIRDSYYAGLRDFSRGAFMIAREAQVPILPVVMSWRKRRGLYRLFLPKKPCATITIGEPIYPDYMLFSKEQEVDLMQRTVAAMEKLYAGSNGGKSVNYWENKKMPEGERRKIKKKKEPSAKNVKKEESAPVSSFEEEIEATQTE